MKQFLNINGEKKSVGEKNTGTRCTKNRIQKTK